MFELKYIPEKYLQNHPERTVHNLQKISAEDVFSIFSNTNMYSSRFISFKKIFHSNENLEVSQNDQKFSKNETQNLSFKSSIDKTQGIGGDALILAAQSGDEIICKLLLNRGANINYVDEEGRTPLDFAVLHGRVKVVQLLISQGAIINTVNIHGNTPLINSTSTEISLILLQAGAYQTIDHLSDYVGTALHCAVCEGNLATVELLLQYNANINALDKEDQTPLACAVENKAVEIVRYLISKGAFVNTVNLNGNTPLMYSVSSEMTQILLEAGAYETIDHRSKDYISGTALHSAVCNGNLAIIRLLLDYRANINALDEDGRTPLAWAIIKSKIEVVQFLILKGARVDTVNVRGNTPLIHSKSTEISRFLLEAGADGIIDHLSNYADVGTALHCAAKNGNCTTVALLLEHKANINIRDKDGRTPLACAVIKLKIEVVRCLISKGASVNTVNVRGNTPLIHSQRVEISRLLLEAGAHETIDHLNNSAEVGSALHSAAWQGNLAMVELLLQYRANINLMDQSGRTPLDLAVLKNRVKVVEFLVGQGACSTV